MVTREQLAREFPWELFDANGAWINGFRTEAEAVAYKNNPEVEYRDKFVGPYTIKKHTLATEIKQGLLELKERREKTSDN